MSFINKPNKMYRLLANGHACPACDKPVYGKLPTKRYCNKYCRFKLNKSKQKQLKQSCQDLDIFEKKNFEIMSCLIGTKKTSVRAHLDLLRSKGFRTSKYCSVGFHNGIRVYIIAQYAFYVKHSEVYIFLRGESDVFLKGVEERYLLDFPNAESEMVDDDKWSMSLLGIKLSKFLKVHGVNSREMNAVLSKLANWALRFFGIWRI